MIWPLAIICLLIWAYLGLFHHGFWRRREFLPQADDELDWPDITALTPARNEETIISHSVESLLLQNYQGKYNAVLINDNSEDATVAIAKTTINKTASPHEMKIIHAAPLEPGWSGKLWALHNGFESIKEDKAPDYYWLSDADIIHDSETLARLVTLARKNKLGMVSLMVTLNCKTFWETLIIPAFIYYFQMLYPFKATANPKSHYAGGAGGCILIQREALNAIGGISAIKDTLIDDCALAKAVKDKGYKIWLGHGPDSQSIRQSAKLADLWQMVTRTAFTQLKFSYFALFGAIFGMFLIYTVPVITLLTGLITGRFLVAVSGVSLWMIMATTYLPTIRAYGRNPAASLLLPFTAHMFMAMTLHSAWLHFKGTHSGWRGRIYDNQNHSQKCHKP